MRGDAKIAFVAIFEMRFECSQVVVVHQIQRASAESAPHQPCTCNVLQGTREVHQKVQFGAADGIIML